MQGNTLVYRGELMIFFQKADYFFVRRFVYGLALSGKPKNKYREREEKSAV